MSTPFCCLHTQKHLPLGWSPPPPIQKAFEILVYKSQPKRSCLSATDWGLGSSWSWSSVIWFQFSLCFYLSLGLLTLRVSFFNVFCCLLFEFIVYTIQTVGQEAWQAVQYTNCVCCKVYRSRKHLCVYRLGLSMISLGIPLEEPIEFPSYHCICLHTLHIYFQ